MKSAFLLCALALPPESKIDRVKRLEVFMETPYVMMGVEVDINPMSMSTYRELEAFIYAARPGVEIVTITDKYLHPKGWEKLPFTWHDRYVFVRKARRSA